MWLALRMRPLAPSLAASVFLFVLRYSAARNRDLYYPIGITFADNTLLTLWFLAFISVISDLKSAFVKFDLPTRVYQINGECIGENMNRW